MKSAIVIMSRAPKPGQTKTRLMEKLTAEECVEFHLACLKDICQAVSKIEAHRYIFYAGDKREFGSLELSGFVLSRQRGNDLGQRLYNAAKQVLDTQNKVVFIGADMPNISPQLLQSALLNLDDYDVVIGPALDGGYYLLGMKYPHLELFQNIPWGTAGVFKITLEILKSSNLSCLVLENQRDIDTWDDLISFYTSYDSGYDITELTAFRNAMKLIEKYGMSGY